MIFKKIIILALAIVMTASFTACGKDDNSKSTTNEVSSVSDVASTASKTISIASVEPLESIDWPSDEALAGLPKLCDTVDYYVDESTGGQPGSYEIQIKDLVYSEFKAYAEKLMAENGFSAWATLGESVLPDELADGQTAFCPVTNNDSLWGILEYNPAGNSNGNKAQLVFYNYNPYSGY